MDASGVAYSDYTSAGYSAVLEADFPAYRARAWAIVRQVTRRAVDDTLTAAETTDAIAATVAAIDALHSAGQAVSSESIGSYSVSYASPASEQDAYRVVRAALAGSGLSYIGLEPTAYL